MLLGVIEILSERTRGRPYAHFQARLDALDSRVREKLGPAVQAARGAGRVLGRGDQITPTLWPAANRARGPAADRGLPLTRREREIAELIAHGLTNRQIAARLFIAEPTVDTHMGHILANLGCTSRAQVAAIIAAHSALAASEHRHGRALAAGPQGQ
jgi:DNA-binding NarL/FixJ family response regulator